MTESFEPQLPDQSGRRLRPPQWETDQPMFELSVRPADQSPRLCAFLPAGGAVPVPFDATARRDAWQTCSPPRTTDELDYLSRACVQSVYAPGGEVGDLGVHTACRLSLVREQHQRPEMSTVYHDEIRRQAFDGDPERQVYSDWVTTETETTSSSGLARTVHWHRRPVIRLREIPASVQRPVIEYACVIQATDWGVVETCAYLTPDPDQRRARELAETLADSVMHQVTSHPVPVEIGHCTTNTTARESDTDAEHRP